jgi:hypothetical protein
MIPAGQDGDTHAKKVFGDFRSDPEARGGIFSVSDDQIDVVMLNEVREPVTHDLTAGRAHNIADEKSPHEESDW